MTNTIDSLMTLVDELQYAAREEAHDCAGAYEVNELIAARKALDAALAETQRDAERYRFLRTSNRISGEGIGASVKSDWLWNLDFEALDATIDAAMEGAE
jgi:hypothetical protein